VDFHELEEQMQKTKAFFVIFIIIIFLCATLALMQPPLFL